MNPFEEYEPPRGRKGADVKWLDPAAVTRWVDVGLRGRDLSGRPDPRGRAGTSVFGFFALLRVAVRDEIAADPEIVVVFDGELGSTARREADPAYNSAVALQSSP